MAHNPFAAIEAHHRELVIFLTRKLGCPILAADLAQEAFLRLADSQLKYKLENPRAFLFRVATNLVIDHLRQEKTRTKFLSPETVLDDVPGISSSPETIVDDRQRLEILRQVVNELPPKCREVFILRKFEQLEQAEIAERLGISRNMVEKHLRKALIYCRDRLRQLTR